MMPSTLGTNFSTLLLRGNKFISPSNGHSIIKLTIDGIFFEKDNGKKIAKIIIKIFNLLDNCEILKDENKNKKNKKYVAIFI